MAGDTKQCPYCMAQIPAAARKCQHCGEWVEKPPEQSEMSKLLGRPEDRPRDVGTGSVERFFGSDNLEDTLNEGIKLRAKVGIVSSIVGGIIFLIVASQVCTQMNEFDRGPTFGRPQIVQE